MTEVKAILQIRTGSYDDYYNANLTYRLGEHTFILSGANVGRWKVGDGITPWRSLPLSPRTAANALHGLVAGSTAYLFGVINADGTFTLNGLAAKLDAIDATDAAQDERLDGHDDDIAEINDQIAAMEGAIIYIGNIDYFTAELNAMTDEARYAALDARTIAIRGRLETGYTLEDKGAQDQPGRNMNYWQRQADGTWFDLGERAEISWATNSHGGIVRGSTAEYKIKVETDGTMSVNGLTDKLAELDEKDEELGEDISSLESDFSDFKTAQEATNEGVAEALSEIETKDTAQDGRLDAIEEKDDEQDTALQEAVADLTTDINTKLNKSVFTNGEGAASRDSQFVNAVNVTSTANGLNINARYTDLENADVPQRRNFNVAVTGEGGVSVTLGGAGFNAQITISGQGAIDAAAAYTDQRIAAAISGSSIGLFYLGRSASATPFPAPSTAGAKAFDFETNTPYQSIEDGAGGFIWDALPPITPQEGVKIDVMEMLDGTGVDGGDLAGKGATGLFVSGAWQFVEQSGVLGAPPNDGKFYAMRNGVWVEILVDY